MIEVPSLPEQVVVVGEFPFYKPEELFAYWVTPELLKEWWPPEAEVDPRLGGKYRFSWPSMNWHLSGEYTTFEQGKELGFTWSWNHDPSSFEPLQVTVFFMETADGTRMSIFHGPFAGSDAEARQGILEGWIHFGMRLAGLRRTEPEDGSNPIDRVEVDVADDPR
jgi:uncharacterized protein YndB with AHSA1/START domain